MDRFFVPERSWEAHVLCGLLETEGILARVVNGDFANTEGVGPAEVWVENASDPLACEVLAKYLQRKKDSDAGERRCMACGEMNPANFEVCWSCQRSF
jgi:hypothetical protein